MTAHDLRDITEKIQKPYTAIGICQCGCNMATVVFITGRDKWEARERALLKHGRPLRVVALFDEFLTNLVPEEEGAS